MNFFTGSRILVLAAVLAIGFTSQACAAEGEAVVNAAKRQEALDQAKKLLVTPSLSSPGKDPFHSEAYAESIAGATRAPESQAPSGDTAPVRATTGPRNAHDLLQTIAASLKPSGFFVLGGQPTLVFGQKRVKAGGFLTITFEGAEYTLEIVSIERPNFTLRLNREEFTRPIK